MKNSQRMHAQGGQAMLIAVLLFVAISTAAVFGLANPVARRVGRITMADNSKAGYFLSESLAEDVAYRLMNRKTVSSAETLMLDGQTASAVITDLPGRKKIASQGDFSGASRKVELVLTTGEGVAFFYGIQAGDGGFVMENSSSVSGNVYSNGSIRGTGSSVIRGDVISAGPAGLIEGVNATGSAYSHTIRNATIGKDAFFTTLSTSIVQGTKYPGASDLATSTMPITDEKIDEWKAEAEAGGVTNCTGTLTISTATIVGPRKYTCNLEFKGNMTITLKGHVWVTGNITSQNNPTYRIDSSLGQSGVVFIADNPSDRTTSSKIVLNNGGTFYGTGSTTSYVMFVSQNESAENGGTEVAVDVSNSVSGKVLVYAPHGEILLRNSVSLKEVTSHRIRLINAATATYETGLANLLFTSGPSGGYEIESWNEVAN